MLNMKNGSKVRIFITPSRIRRAIPCDSMECAVSLSVAEQLGLKHVATSFTQVVGRMKNGRAVKLTPVNGAHHYKFVNAFDKSLTRYVGRPRSTSITYIVNF